MSLTELLTFNDFLLALNIDGLAFAVKDQDSVQEGR